MTLSGTSTAAPVVSGSAALLLQLNPNLTPGMVKMMLEYSAQPLAGADMFEQGAGELNVDGAVKLAKSVRTDIDLNSAQQGVSLLATSGTSPQATSTIGGTTFGWSQLILSGQTFVTGQDLVTKYQTVYRRGNLFLDGVYANFGNGLADPDLLHIRQHPTPDCSRKRRRQSRLRHWFACVRRFDRRWRAHRRRCLDRGWRSHWGRCLNW